MQLTATPKNPLPYGPMPARTHSATVVRVQFHMQAEGFEKAAFQLETVLLGKQDLMVKLFEQAVVRSLVVNIRRRYLATMEKSLEMKTLEDSGAKVMFSPRRRMRDVQLKSRLQRAFDRLNEAQMDGNVEAAEKVHERIMTLGAQLRERMGQNPQGKAMKPHRLSALSGGQFRRRLLALLGLLTDASFVQGHRVKDSVVVGVGPAHLLNTMETPSATMALTGHPTASRLKTFWRHVEFGTGARRSAAKDRLNRASNPAQPWWYGKNKRSGLLLEGTAPMNFLTTGAGTMYPNDITSLSQALTETLDALLRA